MFVALCFAFPDRHQRHLSRPDRAFDAECFWDPGTGRPKDAWPRTVWFDGYGQRIVLCLYRIETLPNTCNELDRPCFFVCMLFHSHTHTRHGLLSRMCGRTIYEPGKETWSPNAQTRWVTSDSVISSRDQTTMPLCTKGISQVQRHADVFALVVSKICFCMLLSCVLVVFLLKKRSVVLYIYT